jgi:long-chain fatty acid transport protein
MTYNRSKHAMLAVVLLATFNLQLATGATVVGDLKDISIQALNTTTQVPENWRNTFTAGIAGDWKFAENWIVRGGYQHYKTPVPDSTFSPTIPDSDQNVITAGLQYHWGRHAIEGAYGYVMYDDRHIDNGPAYPFNGDYKWNVHLFALSYNFAF